MRPAGRGAGRELLERAEPNLQDLEESRVAKRGRDLALLREGASVARHVHLGDELLEQLRRRRRRRRVRRGTGDARRGAAARCVRRRLQAEHEVPRRGVQKLGNLLHDRLVLLARRPAELGDGGDDLHQVARHEGLDGRAALREVRERVVSKVQLLRRGQVVPRLHEQLLQGVGRDELRVGVL